MLEKIIKFRKFPILKYVVKILFVFIGVDIPEEVQLGERVRFPHNSYGTVIHPNTIIKDDVKIYQNVTIGRADIYRSFNDSNMNSIVVSNNVILSAGCKVLSKDKELVIGKNSIIAANAVLLKSTGENEIWAGIPAKKIGYIK